jgi:hypothetical protein
VHNTLGFPRSLFEVLVCFGPGDNRELLAAVGLRYYRAYKEVASLRTEAPETPTLQRAISTQSKIQISRREEQLILGPTRACARCRLSLFSLFSTLLAPWLRARDVMTTTSYPHHLEPPSPPAATAMPPTRGHPPGAALSPPLSSSTPRERGLPYPRTREGPPLSPTAARRSWRLLGERWLSLGARPNSLTVYETRITQG